jgi:hypothetical protein
MGAGFPVEKLAAVSGQIEVGIDILPLMESEFGRYSVDTDVLTNIEPSPPAALDDEPGVPSNYSESIEPTRETMSLSEMNQTPDDLSKDKALLASFVIPETGSTTSDTHSILSAATSISQSRISTLQQRVNSVANKEFAKSLAANLSSKWKQTTSKVLHRE